MVEEVGVVGGHVGLDGQIQARQGGAQPRHLGADVTLLEKNDDANEGDNNYNNNDDGQDDHDYLENFGGPALHVELLGGEVSELGLWPPGSRHLKYHRSHGGTGAEGWPWPIHRPRARRHKED